MSPLERKRNARGQYETGFNAAEEGSVVGKLVREEYEAFVERLKDKLNAVSAAELADIETPNWKNDIRSVLSQYLGASTAKVAVNFVKNPTPWNLFTKANYARNASELRDEDAPGMTFSAYLKIDFQESQRRHNFHRSWEPLAASTRRCRLMSVRNTPTYQCHPHLVMLFNPL